ncbi:patatin-like phospholipase family protein [Bradyrhizobium quebecense]|uniref:Patatin-like phospholipase family protein n=2 Tax=Bradyrhizobium quebecense TaxID=2748629 RepID=A0A973WS34_9BRAD|nr:patatin-like phospholipase family protein [Bradyrhizobium quebecense]UGA48490.1 patatin-like phospholipase family protein [Bradyrhizobium quebecense]UGY07361.1 patatin-like phospholipase family protein [Bradyrhizobium quebecense]
MLVAAVAVGLAGCATVYNLPGNVPLGNAAADTNGVSDIPAYEDDLLLALSFSGGGTRAAAFSFGVLEELDRVRSSAAGTKTLLDRVDFVSGVSGGSVTAAYFGLKRRAALDDFRERFLLRNAEEGLKTRISLGNIGRALGGGVNDSQFTDWLDQNLFDGARFEALPDDRRPRVWINASDIYNRTPFVFGKTSFDALCSDIRSYRVAEAVAASAAVPLAFAPIVLQTYPGGCAAPLPSWLDRVRNDPNAQPLLRSYAEAQARYRGGSMRYVKLLDGGLVDNYGLSGLSIGLLAAQRPYEPLSERQAAKLRRILFLVVDAGRGISGDFVQTLEGPSGVELVSAAADTAIDASVRSSYAAFTSLANDWSGKLKHWRCGLSAADRARLGVGAGWKCGDVAIYVERLGFDRFGPERAGILNAIPTRLSLPPEQVDQLITGGADALRSSKAYQQFRRGL